MVCLVISIILSIISFFHPWFFIGVCIALVLGAVEYILELTHADIFDSAAIGASVIVLGVGALILGVIAIIVALNKINSGESSSKLLLGLFDYFKLFIK